VTAPAGAPFATRISPALCFGPLLPAAAAAAASFACFSWSGGAAGERRARARRRGLGKDAEGVLRSCAARRTLTLNSLIMTPQYEQSGGERGREEHKACREAVRREEAQRSTSAGAPHGSSSAVSRTIWITSKSVTDVARSQPLPAIHSLQPRGVVHGAAGGGRVLPGGVQGGRGCQFV